MRHRQKGRHLGRTSSHRKALFRNLACALILTEQDPLFFEGLKQADGKTPVNPPAHPGRIITTLQKAREVRRLVERCVTIARDALPHEEAAESLKSTAERGSAAWKSWREGDGWKKWVEATTPATNARRRVFDLLRDKEAVSILFTTIAPRYTDRPGGYTRVLRLAKPRLGDAGTRAILEFVGKHERVKRTEAVRPAFETGDSTES
jgi:large subunit ribosomal protein L17